MRNTKKKNFFTFNIQKIINKKVNIFVFEKLKFSIKRFYFLTNLKKKKFLTIILKRNLGILIH